MTDIKITRAKLIPMEGDKVVTDQNQHIEVQFNPSTLKITLSNSLKSDSKGGSSGSKNAAQFVEKSESSLSIELLFDTTVSHEEASHAISQNEKTGVSHLGNETERKKIEANSDVRLQTKRIAKQFMDPNGENKKPRAPIRCRFQWGKFQFTGMVSSYSETLDFFAPEGIPLRATLALTLKEDRYQFDMDEGAPGASPRAAPSFNPGASADKAAQAAGMHPSEWRSIAKANDMETPRQTNNASK